MITKDGRDTPIDKLTKDNYIVPKGEEMSYHAVIEVVQYDQKTGNKLSIPRVQKFGKKQFESNVHASLKKQGYTVTILHDPNDWLAEQKEKVEKAKAEQAAAKAKAEKEKFNAAVKEEVARQLAERDAKAEQAAKAKQQAEQAEQGKEQAKKPGRPAKGE